MTRRRINPGKAFAERMDPIELRRWLRKVRLDRRSECWVWEGYVDANGYGFFKFRGMAMAVHRLAFATFVGPIEAGMEVNHIACCMHRRCVNPAHLEQLTAKENRRDGSKRRWSRNGAGGAVGSGVRSIDGGVPADESGGRRAVADGS